MISATKQLIENKIKERIVKSKPVPREKSESVQKIYIPSMQRQEILNNMR